MATEIPDGWLEEDIEQRESGEGELLNDSRHDSLDGHCYEGCPCLGNAGESMSKTVRLPIISMYGPWANWVGLGWKTIETRTHERFKSLVGKRIGIHKALKWDDGALDLAAPYLTQAQRAASLSFLRVGGAILYTAFVREHRELNPLDNSAALIDCTHITRYGLFLEDVRMIEMIPCRGKQGIWYHNIPVLEPRA